MNNIPDDVWFEILLRLPLTAIFNFQSVCKVWFSILSSPNFMHKWYKLNNFPWGLIHFARYSSNDNNCNNKFRKLFTLACPDSHSQFIENHQTGFSLDFLNPVFPDNKEEDLFMIGSSSGLVLCSTGCHKQNTYYVCNPLTQKWVSLPPHNKVVTAFICKDTKDFSGYTSFKVIRIPEVKVEGATKELLIEVFSSESGEWNSWNVSCPGDGSRDVSPSDNLITSNGVFYWFQKGRMNPKVLALSIDGNKRDGTCGNECSLINLPEQTTIHDELRHCLAESEGFICYAIFKRRERSLSVWVLKEQEWCLLYKDNDFLDMLSEMRSLMIGEIGRRDFITGIEILGLNPVDRNVVILSYDKYVWAYNTRTKGFERLYYPSCLRSDGSSPDAGFLTFILKPWPSVLPPISW